MKFKWQAITVERHGASLEENVSIYKGGDGVDYDETLKILETVTGKGWATDNLAFGCGGALLQKLNRDTQKFAFKCSSVDVNGEVRDVWKDPITDAGKASKRGRLALARIDNEWTTVSEGSATDHLVEVYRNGELLVDSKFDEIRRRSRMFKGYGNGNGNGNGKNRIRF